MGLEVPAVLGEAGETELSRAADRAPADLAAHLAVAGPAQAQAWQRPPEERDAVRVGERPQGSRGASASE
jgi:hypothetical protein